MKLGHHKGISIIENYTSSNNIITTFYFPNLGTFFLWTGWNINITNVLPELDWKLDSPNLNFIDNKTCNICSGILTGKTNEIWWRIQFYK